MTDTATAPPNQPERLEKPKMHPLMAFGYRRLLAFERFIGRHAPHGNHTFFDPADFPWTRELEAHWEVIRDELDAVMARPDAIPNFQQISTEQSGLTQDDGWKTFFLYGFGYRSETNAARCPETTRLVEAVPGMMTAFFSILAPGKHIPSHRGPYKGILRYHLGLRVPTDAERCRIRVGDEIRHWEDGESLLFDDTYQHEVWNDTDETRVVLFMDVERPLNAPVSWLNRFLISTIRLSPFVQRARKNAEAFEGGLEEALKRG